MGIDNNLTRSETTPQLSVVTQSGLWGEKHHAMTKVASRSLAERFVIPPFSVFDARQGYWQERKRLWISRGIKSEVGRGTDGDGTTRGLVFASSAQPPSVYKKKNEYEAKVGRVLTWEEFYKIDPGAWEQTGTSIFDPVLCEVMYSWFCPPGGAVLDPFAGGSVRGLIAAHLGLHYKGIDLSERQVVANYNQVQEVIPDAAISPCWLVGDSRSIPSLIKETRFDFVFSCPPYFNLEQYSDDEQDLSNCGNYADFLEGYNEIIEHCVAALLPNRFAAFVVGVVRDKKTGLYHDLVGDTVRAFEMAGAAFYNSAILITAGGSIAMRAGRQFAAGRKLANSFGNVLVFVKGDWRMAVESLGEL